MKLTSVFKYNLPFESWLAVYTPTPNGGTTLSYQKGSDERGMIIQAAGGINLITEEALPIGSQVRDLLDSEGNEIFVVSGSAYVMYVNTSDPQFDPWSRIIGWKHQLKRTLPTGFEHLEA